MKVFKYFLITLILGMFFLPLGYIQAGVLSCSIVPSFLCAGLSQTVILRLSGDTNAHAELSNQSNLNYANNLVCCSASPSSISNSCSGNYVKVGVLSNNTNAHIQETTINTYDNKWSVCLSSVTTGDRIEIGYQDNNCSGYDTTLFSISSSDNATLGDENAYTRKVCGSIISPQISFSISDNLVGFGNLSSGASRYATGDGIGSGTEVEAHTISASSNADSGYVITIEGTTLTSNNNTIDPIGGTNSSPSPGNEQFGLRATIVSGTGSISSPYSGSGFALDSSNFPDEIATGSGDDSTTIYSLRYLGNINQYTEAGNYTANLTYIMTGTF